MPQVMLPTLREGETLEQKMLYLTDNIYKLRKELSFLLGNLDSDNVLEAQSVIADWVYAGTVTTDQLIVGEAKIGSALIESIKANQILIGGVNGTISFEDLSDQPDIPTTADITQITANYIATPNLITNIAQVSKTLSLGLQTDTDTKSITFYGSSSGNSKIVATKPDAYSVLDVTSSTINFHAWDSIQFDGTVIFQGSTLGVDVGDDYVKSHTGQDLSLVATETGIAVRVNGVTLGSILYD